MTGIPVEELLLAKVAERMLLVLKKTKAVPNSLTDICNAAPMKLPEYVLSAADAGGSGSSKKRKIAATVHASYKEMWTRNNAEVSLERNKLYEAGGSALWCSFNPADSLADAAPDSSSTAHAMPIHLGSWSQLQEAKALFKPSVHFQGRILFPVTLDTACRSTAEVTMGAFPKSLKLLSNHLVVAAWWAACYDALQAADDERVGKLYECAQTCTLRVSLWESNAQVMRIALESSEKHRAIATTCTIDNIVLFADRLSIIVQDCPGGTSKQLEYLKENGVLFRQKEIGRNTLTGASCPSFYLKIISI